MSSDWKQYQAEDIATNNERSLKKLTRAITYTSGGRFTLILVLCNYTKLQQQIMLRLREQSSTQIRELELPKSAKNLYTAIQEEIKDNQPPTLIVSGLESVIALDDFLRATNQVRDEFKKSFFFSLVLWLNDEGEQKLAKLAPDFRSWAGVPINFAMTPNEPIEFLEQSVEQLFTAVLNADSSQFQSNADILGADYCSEIKLAKKALENRAQSLSPELEAGLQFVLGREDYANYRMGSAKEHYQQSWEFFKNSNNPEWQGVLLFHMGLCHARNAQLQLTENRRYWQEARDSLQKCINIFEEAQRPDLIAKFINPLGESLLNLKAWKALESLAQQALELHQDNGSKIQLAENYGFLAQVKFNQGNWSEASQLAQQALETLEQAGEPQPQAQGSYLLVLAQSQQQLGDLSAAFKNLEKAKNIEVRPSVPLHQHSPHLYIRILEVLRLLYFQQDNYLRAFQLKQEQRSIEQQYRIRAFIGAGSLQPRQQEKRGEVTVAEEITTSGRKKDLDELLDRIGSTQHKLTVIHGHSGVGKSSIVQAGLVPALEMKTIEGRRVLSITLSVYTDWVKALEKALAEALGKFGIDDFRAPEDSQEQLKRQNLIEQLRQNEAHNLLTVLIFDQFEKFFFLCQDKAERQSFFHFLRDCLNLPYVKVVLLLREEYLHYLLEGERLVDLESINNDILTIKNRQYLGNLSKENAISLIQTITNCSQFNLESALVDELVRSLAGELEEVRPIELQIVGSQLQTDGITTLAQYQKYGSASELVKGYLKEVIEDCGSKNKRTAGFILYLLTEENNTCPSKTRTELLKEVRQQALKINLVVDEFDSILNIFVGSGLVFQIPAFPEDRYQLVQDYLVSFIRELWLKEDILNIQEPQLPGFEGISVEKGKTPTINKLASSYVIASQTITPIARSPYPEMKRFELKDKDLFWGRDYLVKNLIEELGESSLILLLGATGSGKSSVVRAGLIPKLSELLGSKFRNFILTPLADPFRSLYSSLIDRGYEQSKAEIALKGETDTLTQVVQTLKENDSQWLIFVDQFEEIFTICQDEKRKRFIESLVEIANLQDGSVKIIIAMRAEFIDALSQYPDLVKIAQNNIQLVADMLPDELRLAIEQPAAKHGVVFEEGLVEEIIRDVQGQASYLPLLQCTLNLLWESECQSGQIENRTLKVKTYRELGGVRGALQERGERIYNDLSPTEQLATKQIFLRLVNVVGSESSDTVGKVFSRRAERSEFAGDLIKSMLDKLINENLLFCNDTNQRQQPTVEIAHEALLNSWQRLQSWIEEARQVIVLKNRLAEDAKLWKVSLEADETKANDELWSGSKLEQILELKRENTFDLVLGGLSEDENEFIDASVRWRDRLLREKEAENEKLARALTEINLLQQAAKVLNLLPTQPLNALVLAIGSIGLNLEKLSGKILSPVQTSLGRAMEIARESNTFQGHENSVISVAFSPDGQMIVSGSRDKTVHLWNIQGNPICPPFQGHEDWVNSVAFSPDGQMIVSGSRDKTVRLWNIKGNPIAQPFQGHSDSVNSVTFSPDGQMIVSGSFDKTVCLWDIQGNPICPPFQGHEGSVNSVAFSPDGQMIVSGSFDKTVRLWDRKGNPISQPFQGHEGYVFSVAFSPDGQMIVSGSTDKTVRLWDIQGNPSCLPFQGHSDSVYSVAFSPDGQMIVSGSFDKTVRLWDIQGNPICPPFQGHEGSVYSVAFSQDGLMIVSVSDEYTVRLWDIKCNPISQLFQGHTDSVNSVTFSPDGQMIVSGSDDYTVRLWDIQGNPICLLFQGHTDSVNSVAFSPNGQMIVSGSDDYTVRLWDIQGNPICLPFQGHTDSVNSVAFSPDGQMIVSGSLDRTVRLWDIQGNPICLPFQGHTDSVNSVAFSPDGQMIVSGSTDKTVRLWRGSWQAWLKVGCERLHYHPVFKNPETDVQKQACSTCAKYVWKKMRNSE
ncbi:MAG: AAA family ATPase [Xenococcaceae cyanobacterium]